MAVVRQLGDGTTVSLQLDWIDAIGGDDAETSTVARSLGVPESAIRWLDDDDRQLGPRADHGVLHFGVTSRSDASTARRSNDFTTLVVVWGERTLTVHEADDSLVDAAVARLAGEPAPGRWMSVVFALVDELLERYERLVEQLGRDHEDHAVAVVGRSSSVQSSEEVVADGLRLARGIADAQRNLRRVDSVLNGLRLVVTSSDDADAVAAAIGARMPEITALQSDLDSLDRHLELTTNARMSLISARQNEINKAIGAWGGVFAVNAVITGWYGMNIDGLPGSGSWLIASAVMVVVTIAMILLFRRIDWL